MEVVINRCFGGFSLSQEAYEYLGIPWDGYGFEYRDYDLRTEKELIECVRTLGERANGDFAKLKIVSIPDDVKWYIEDYDGKETVEEEHRYWR